MSNFLAIAEVARIADYLATACGDDAQLFADMVEAETPLADMVGKAHDLLAGDEELIVGIKDRQAALAERRSRLEARVRSAKTAIGMMLRAGQVAKIELPEATYSVRDGKPGLKIVDRDGVPMSLCEPQFVPAKDRINAAYKDADVLPNWLVREDARDVVTARRK